MGKLPKTPQHPVHTFTFGGLPGSNVRKEEGSHGERGVRR